VDRCVTPWLVAAMHRPMYVVYPHKSNRIVGGARRLEHQSQHITLRTTAAQPAVDMSGRGASRPVRSRMVSHGQPSTWNAILF